MEYKKRKRQRSRDSSSSSDSDYSPKEMFRKMEKLGKMMVSTSRHFEEKKRRHRSPKSQWGDRLPLNKKRDTTAQDRSPRGSATQKLSDRALRDTTNQKSPDRVLRDTTNQKLQDRARRDTTNKRYGNNNHDDSTSSSSSTSSQEASDNEIPSENPQVNTQQGNELDTEVLTLLGEDPQSRDVDTAKLHPAVLTRWAHILSNGLDKEVKSELTKKYVIPSNCLGLRAPTLNPEIKAALAEVSIKKDNHQIITQNLLATGITALGTTIHNLLTTSTFTKEQINELLPALSDAGRLLCDLHHTMSITRRQIITPTLNKTVRDVSLAAPIDEMLYGRDFHEKFKTIKEMEKSSRELKTLNYRGPARVRSTQPRGQAPQYQRGRYNVKNPKYPPKYPMNSQKSNFYNRKHW